MITEFLNMDRIFSAGAEDLSIFNPQSEGYTKILEQKVRVLLCKSTSRHSNTPLLLSN